MCLFLPSQTSLRPSPSPWCYPRNKQTKWKGKSIKYAFLFLYLWTLNKTVFFFRKLVKSVFNIVTTSILDPSSTATSFISSGCQTQSVAHCFVNCSWTLSSNKIYTQPSWAKQRGFYGRFFSQIRSTEAKIYIHFRVHWDEKSAIFVPTQYFHSNHVRNEKKEYVAQRKLNFSERTNKKYLLQFWPFSDGESGVRISFHFLTMWGRDSNLVSFSSIGGEILVFRAPYTAHFC